MYRLISLLLFVVSVYVTLEAFHAPGRVNRSAVVLLMAASAALWGAWYAVVML
jgi:hypothetical protein